MPLYLPPDDAAARLEREAVAAIFDLLNQLQGMGYDPSQTITTFLANLVCDQPNPHNILKQLFAITREKMLGIQNMARGKMPPNLPDGVNMR